MNVFWREIRAYRKSAIIWALALSLLIVAFLSIYTSFTQDVETSKKILSNLPPAVTRALDIEMSNFFTIFGFFSYLLTFTGLAGAVQAMNYGVGVLSKEESGKTADFLLTKPISRTRVYINKLFACLVLILFTNLVFSTVALVAAKIVSPDDFSGSTFLLVSGILLLIQLFFVGIGMLLSQLVAKIKSSMTIALPTVFAFFFIGIIGAIIDDKNLYYLTPFKYYDTDYIIANNIYEAKFLIIEAAVVVVALIISYLLFVRKDVRAPA